MKAKAADYKKKTVKEMNSLIKENPIVGIVNLEGLPAQQLQAMRSDLRETVTLFMTKKRLMKIALENAKAEKKGIEELEQHLVGMPALLVTKESPFKLSKTLAKSKTAAPAKAGQIAPNDIIVPAGPTPFAPGPVISELGEAGLEVGVENGKVAVKEDSVVAKKGEEITAKVADVLTRLDIKPMTIGLDLVAAYEEGLIYGKDVLEIDEQEYINNVNTAAAHGINLAFEVGWVMKENIEQFISKAFNEAKALGIEQNIIDEKVIDELLGKAERSMLSLKSQANIETVEKPKEAPKEEASEQKPAEQKKEDKPAEAPAETPKPAEQPKAEAKPAEEKKPEPKEESAPAEKKPEAKPEEKKEESKQESQSTQEQPKPEEKKEEKPSEEPKVDEKEKQEMKEAEDLAKELVQKGTLRK